MWMGLWLVITDIQFVYAQSVQALITNPAIPTWNKLRLVMLYALRYQKSQANSVASLISLALENGVSREDARVSETMGLYCQRRV